MPVDPFVGQILFFPFNFPPKGYAFCQGQLLPIQQNTALFSLLGTYYGGNGVTNFALPNLQGKVPLGFGQGAGLTDHSLGQVGGSEIVTLTTPQMPAHSHAVSASSATVACKNGAGNQQTPVGNVPATESAGVTATYGSAPPNDVMRTGNIALSGTAATTANAGGQPHENRQPFLTINYCIALQGVYPPRS